MYSTEPWIVNPSTKAWLDAAASDFEKAAEKDPKNDLAFDRLGLAYEEAGEEDNAVRAYTQELALNDYGKQRLADAYCFFGFRHQQQKDLAAAAAAYEKSTEFGIADDKSCPSDPFGNSVAIYTNETHERQGLGNGAPGAEGTQADRARPDSPPYERLGARQLTRRVSHALPWHEISVLDLIEDPSSSTIRDPIGTLALGRLRRVYSRRSKEAAVVESE